MIVHAAFQEVPSLTAASMSACVCVCARARAPTLCMTCRTAYGVCMCSCVCEYKCDFCAGGDATFGIQKRPVDRATSLPSCLCGPQRPITRTGRLDDLYQ